MLSPRKISTTHGPLFAALLLIAGAAFASAARAPVPVSTPGFPRAKAALVSAGVFLPGILPTTIAAAEGPTVVAIVSLGEPVGAGTLAGC